MSSAHKTRWGLGIGLSVTSVVLILLAAGTLLRIEWITYDYRMRLHRSEKPLSEEVAVVLIDESSLQAMEPLVGRFPWPRTVFADLIEFLSMGGARAIVFDILFAEDEGGNRQLTVGDDRLSQASAQVGRVYHAAQLMREESSDVHAGILNPPLPEDFRHHALAGQGFPDGGNNNFLLPIDRLIAASRGIGIVGIDADADSVYRRVHLFPSYHGLVFPSLGVAPLARTSGASPIVHDGGSIRFGDATIPLDDEGHYLVNMVGRITPYSIGGVLSSIDKLRAGDVENLLVFPDEFEDKIVFIGASAAGLADIKTTPISSKTPGVLIHASVATNILERDFLRPVSRTTNALVIAALSLLTVYAIFATHRVFLQILYPLLIAALYGVWSVSQFAEGVVYELAAPLSAVALAWLSAFAYLIFTEGRDKRRVRTMLSQYVSPAVLAEVVDRYRDHLKAEVGSTEHLSVLFSDIRGFTSISESLSAAQVVELLNVHFSVMSDVIFANKGTLDKFIGDAIMAFWGAPIRIDNHADQAVISAIEMTQSMRRVNELLLQKNYPPVAIGIGINTGDVVLGNIGSEKKLDYTVIGDNVNLASRLEGLTKTYGCPVLISEYTHSELHGPIPCALVDLVRVKGRQVPIRIYWPLGLAREGVAPRAHTELAEQSREAFEHYFQRRWRDAEALYARMPDCPLREIFLARCRGYRLQEPPDDWDGVFTQTTK